MILKNILFKIEGEINVKWKLQKSSKGKRIRTTRKTGIQRYIEAGRHEVKRLKDRNKGNTRRTGSKE